MPNSTTMAKLQADLPKSPQPKHGTIRCGQLAADTMPGSRNTAYERNGMPSPLIDFTQDPELGSIRLIACDMDCTLLALIVEIFVSFKPRRRAPQIRTGEVL